MTIYSFQSINQNDCNLDSNHIDIWQFSLAYLHPKAFPLLDAEERARAQRYIFPRHQRRFTMARAIMRLILARYLQQNPKDLCFTQNPYGKPGIKSKQNIQFNLSHSRDLALLAVGAELPLGIDLEFFSERPYDDLAKHVFSNLETNHLLSLSHSMKAMGFFHIWAQKEAFIKACGMGLSYPTKTFTVPCSLQTNETIFDEKHHRYWHMRSFMPQIACCAALCSDPSIKIIRYITINNQVFNECPAS